MIAALPENEPERLLALHRYGALSSIPESSFARLTRLAAHLFSAPVAMVTLLEADRLVIKSSHGIEISEIARTYCFCAHAILSGAVTIVSDLTQDARFMDNPVVTGDTQARFYAGALLETADGFRLGTICVFDTVPRYGISPAQTDALKDLAAEVMELLELHRAKAEIAVMHSQLSKQRIELEESRELWRKTDQRASLALEAGRMGYWERDPATDLVTISASLAAILGLEPQEYQFSMEDWIQSVHPDDRATVLATIENAGRTQESYLMKYRYSHSDGSERWLTSAGKYRNDAAGNFAGAQGVGWDSTDAEKAASQLKMSEELFRGLSESVPVGVFRADLQGRMTYVNPRTIVICGRPAQDLLGSGWTKSVHPEDLPNLSAAIAANNGSLASGGYEYRITLPDGSVRWMQARTSVTFDQSGQPVDRIGTLDDITERRQTMQYLGEAKEAAEVASRTKDMFLSNVSHELRTPLNGILGMTEMLLDHKLSRQQQEMVETVRESGHSLLTLVNDLLDVGRIEAGKIVIERIAFNLPAVIQQTVSVIESEAWKKGLRVQVNYPVDLPGSYFGDPHRIKQILLNYLSNAVKFSTSGDVDVSVSGEAGAGGDTKILLSVRDNGLGIDAEAQKKLFRPFSQVDGSNTRRNGGVGLGLAISKRLAELMGGMVSLDSTLGQGSTFRLHLTLDCNTEDNPAPMHSESPAQQTAGRVLLVEDNVINQKVAVWALRKLGWEADVAPNGVAALDLFRRNEYALVLMDCHMPEMDGFAATREIRQWENGKRRASVPVLALTAHAMTGDRERCLAAGMNDYLAKPFCIEDLRNAINRWTPVHA